MTNLFIFGVARSGTNLLARLLNTHPKINLLLDPFLPIFKSLLKESVSINHKLKKINKIRYLPDYYFFDDIEILLNEIFYNISLKTKIPVSEKDKLYEEFKNRILLENKIKLDNSEKKKIGNYSDYFDLVNKISKNSSEDIEIFGSKEVWSIEFIPSISRYFKDSKFIIINRDPRAIIMSMISLGKKDPSQRANIISYARQWRKNIEIFSILTNMKNFKENLLFLNYEDLLNKTSFIIKKLEDFLDCDLSNDLDLNISGWRGNSSYKKVSGISKKNFGNWEKFIPRDIEDLIIFLCYKEMLGLQYKIYENVKNMRLDAIKKAFFKFREEKNFWDSLCDNPILEYEYELKRFEFSKNNINKLDNNLFLSKVL